MLRVWGSVIRREEDTFTAWNPRQFLEEGECRAERMRGVEGGGWRLEAGGWRVEGR